MIVAGPWRKVNDKMGTSWLPPDCGQDAVVRAILDLSDIDQQKNATAGTGQNERGCGLWAIDCEAGNVPDEYEILAAVDDWTQPNVDGLVRSAWDVLFGVTLPNDMARLDQACLYSLTHGSDPDGVGSGPLWPERRPDNHYYLTVHFGGQSITERFGRGHTHALNRWVPHIHRMLQEHAARDETLAAQWLGWLCHEITADTGVEPNLSVLIPADLYANGFRPLPFHTEISDDFSGDLSAWVTDTGTFTISSGRLTVTQTGSFRRLCHGTAISGSNQIVSANVWQTGTQSSTYVGLWARRDATTGLNTGYCTSRYDNNSTSSVFKFVSSSQTIIGTAAHGGFTDGNVLSNCANGSTIKSLRNGIVMASATDTTYATGTYAGVIGAVNSGRQVQWDHWCARDLVSVPAYSGFQMNTKRRPGKAE